MIPRRPFYFLRHGLTDWNRDGRYQGLSDIPLNERGVQQAEAASRVLAGTRVDRIVTSPLIRALKTAAIVAEGIRAPIYQDGQLRERDFGSFDGLVIRDVKMRHGLPPEQSSASILPADADPWGEIHERVPPVIGRWLAECPDDAILFVAHGGVFDAVHQSLVGPRLGVESHHAMPYLCLLYTSPSPRDRTRSRMPSSA